MNHPPVKKHYLPNGKPDLVKNSADVIHAACDFAGIASKLIHEGAPIELVVDALQAHTAYLVAEVEDLAQGVEKTFQEYEEMYEAAA